MLQPVHSARIAYAAAATKPTAHFNKSRDPVELPEKFRFRLMLRPALRRRVENQ